MNTFAMMNELHRNAPVPSLPMLQDGAPWPMPAAAPSHLPLIGRMPGAARAAGVALAFASDAADACGEDRFAVLVVDAAGAELARLGPFMDDDVVAIWRDCSARAGLSRMIVKEDGALATVSRQIGRVALGTTRTRRRHGLLNHRRPRFLVRRKTGTLPVRPMIHRGENEIGGRLS